jgi:hypothetical protein
MKKLFLFFFGIICTASVFCSNSTFNDSVLKPAVIDKRVELVSIVFRLAGNPEYNQNQFKIYTDAIHNYFDKFKEHPAVQFARRMADSSGVGFDAPMSLAIHIKQPPELDPLFPFSDTSPEKRWGKKNAEHFVTLLKQFYRDAKCEEFFSKQAELYKLVEERFRVVTNALDVSWYKQFYGTAPSGSLNIIIGISNGGCNYGPNVIYPDGKEDAYAIMGTWSVDNNGMPIYKAGYYLSTLIHEFNHSFINYLNEKNISSLEAAGNSVFKPVEEMMRDQAYSTPLYMMNEALVRAAVVRYIARHNPDKDKAPEELKSQLSNGFIWIGGLVDKLEYYENNREKYFTLESFMPEIIEFYNNTAKNMNNLLAKCAHVKSTDGIVNNTAGVSPGITELKLNFDKPIVCENGLAVYTDPQGVKDFPVVKEGTGFTEDRHTLILKLKLIPNTSYYLRLPGLSHHTAEGYPLVDYAFEFKTK